MLTSVFYIILAILGLSVLIFFHELGHYFMARRVGMRVETFAIGFGRPIYSWMSKGVKWQVGWLPFGGYVKIAGQDSEDTRDPYEIPDGYFGKSPWDRIKVSFAGPLVNIVLAFLIFAIIWMMGGREKNFVEFTHKIGWIDPHSELYVAGVRPGDEIISYNDHPLTSFKDHFYIPMTSPNEVLVKGLKVDYRSGQKTPFDYKIKPYTPITAPEKGIKSTGVLSSANYIVYDRVQGGENLLPEGSPMEQSGIQYGDRIVWIDGDLVFSGLQMNRLLNDDKVLLTIVRNGKTVLVRVPRIHVQELKMDPEFKEEITDWQYEADLNNVKLQKLYFIPYNLTNDATVENTLKFIDKEKELELFSTPQNENEKPLLPKDKIIAVDGIPIKTSYQLVKELQQHRVNIIVERNVDTSSPISWKDADAEYDRRTHSEQIQKIANSVGSDQQIDNLGSYQLLKPVIPKTRQDFELSQEKRALLAAEMLEQKKEIETIEDPDRRNQALAQLKNQEKQLLLGLPVQDRKVVYNPSPWNQFVNVFCEIWNTLKALVTGTLNPKWISGPIGIVQVVHTHWMLGIKEALFWLGAISLNLGVLNLLPIPVLDGGRILLSLFEIVTGKRLSPKTLEKLILPFAVLLIIFFIFLTYQDLSRIFGGFLRW